MRVDIKRTKLFDELKQYYVCSEKKFYHQVDNIYYSAFITGDTTDNSNEKVNLMLSVLQGYKEDFLKTNESVRVEGDVLFTNKRFKIYEYNLSCPFKFDIFIGSYIPNSSTPRIVVQLRANAIWLEGEDNVLNESFEFLKFFLCFFDLEVDKVQENRIDYACHTNAIQNPMKYFEDRKLEKTISSTFEIGSKVYRLRRKGKKFDVEYLSLGDRRSNSLFFRIYNKTREVIEKNYKPYFLALWLQEGLISEYDHYCLSKGFDKKSYAYVDKARLEFYIEYGSNFEIKSIFNKALNNRNMTYLEYRDLADLYLPRVSIIMNVEWQTMRRFYYLSDIIDNMNVRDDYEFDDRLLRLYKILDNRKIFLDYLNKNTVHFSNNSGNKTADWWNRMINAKLPKLTDMVFIRDYSHHLDTSRIVSSLKNNLATLSLYLGKENTDLNGDLSVFLNYINDNDLNENDVLINSDSVILNDIDDSSYVERKEKKKKSLSSYLKNLKTSKS